MNGWMDSAMKPLKRKHAYSVSRSLPRLLRSSRGTSSRLFRITAREPNLTFAALILFFFFFPPRIFLPDRAKLLESLNVDIVYCSRKCGYTR